MIAVFMSLENPMYPTVSDRQMAYIDLQALATYMAPTKGVYRGVEEGGIMLLVNELENLQAILQVAKDAGQESVMVGSRGHYLIVYVNGPHEGLCVQNNVPPTVALGGPQASTADGTTYTCPITGQTVHMSVDFDWDTRFPSPY